MEEAKPNNFSSPRPLLIKFRNLVFGRNKPDIYTRLTFYINLIVWVTFMLWNLISYFTITSRDMIFNMKGIPVETIIQNRGIELGFEGDVFLSRLMTYHAISIICWGLVFIGLILLYRKRKQFIYFIMGGTVFYIGMSVFYLSFSYFVEDTTIYDKVALLVVVASTLLHSYLMKNERSGGSISFFGEDEMDEEDEYIAP